MEHLSQEWGDRADRRIGGEEPQRRDRGAPLGAKDHEDEILSHQCEAEAEGERNQGDAFGNSEEVSPERRVVRLHRGEEGGRHLPDQRRDLVHGDVGQNPADAVEAKRSLPQNPPSH